MACFVTNLLCVKLRWKEKKNQHESNLRANYQVVNGPSDWLWVILFVRIEAEGKFEFHFALKDSAGMVGRLLSPLSLNGFELIMCRQHEWNWLIFLCFIVCRAINNNKIGINLNDVKRYQPRVGFSFDCGWRKFKLGNSLW